MKTASQIVAIMNESKVEVDYDSLSKEALIEMVKDLEKRVSNGKTVNELVINMLLDERFLDASNIEIAGAIRILIPGSETTAKSVSSIRSVYNKQVLDKHLLEIDPSLSPKEAMLARAGLEFDLAQKGLLILPRQ